MEELKLWFDNKMSEKLQGVATKDQTQQLIDNIAKNSECGIKNSEDIAKLKNTVDRIETKMNGTVNYAGVAAAATAAPLVESAPVGRHDSPSTYSKEREAFLLSRRSLRVWLIEGSSEDEIKKATVDLFSQALGANARDLGIEKITRVKSAPRGVAYMEILVTFTDAFARDDIFARGPSLANYRDDKNRPTAGIRLDIPAHLMGAFKMLETFGYQLKKKHGNSFRKHIKYDEFEESLFIQVGIKYEDEAVEWSNYSPVEAKETLKKMQIRRGPRFDPLKSPVGGEEIGKKATRTGKENAPPVPGTSGWKPPARDGAATRGWRPPTKIDDDGDDSM